MRLGIGMQDGIKWAANEYIYLTDLFICCPFLTNIMVAICPERVRAGCNMEKLSHLRAVESPAGKAEVRCAVG